jgi:PAS domain S-box-containing protein
MLQKRLISLLLLLILLPTLVVSWMAYRFTVDNIRSERIEIVGRIADSRHEQLKLVLQRASNRANAFLTDVLVKCISVDSLDEACASGFLNDYLLTEGASGALFFRRDAADQAIAVGTPMLSIAEVGEFPPGQLAGLNPRNSNQPRSYYVLAGNQNMSWRLVVIYPVSLLQPIFVSHPDLGKSGETFLADSEGFFISQARYPAGQGYSHPISARPMQACLNHQDSEALDVDYRGKAVIHGFRYIPEIGGGCIMAHIEQAEAFAAIGTMETQLVVAVGLFIILTILIARSLARRIVGPILRITNSARRIREGDLSERVKVRGVDEIAELASSFNHMTDALADAQHNLETKVAERTQELLLSQERYMLAEGAVNDGIWDWNIVEHQYYLSPRWNKILGYAEGELPNVESIFFELIHPDDKKIASDAFSKHLEHGERYATELRLRHKDGSYRWVLDRGEALRDDDGRPYRMVGSIADITERKAAEAELLRYREHLEEMVAMATTEVQAIVKTAANGVISIDSSGAIRMFNPAAERLFGWSAEEVVGRNVSMLMPQPFASAHNDYIQRFLVTNQSKIIGFEREITALRKNGEVFPANLAVGHAVLAEGRHLFVGFMSDISAQKHAEQELRLAKETAETAAKAKANFLANMSHEIRTPMNTIIGFAEVVLQNQNLPSDIHKHVNNILSSGRHLLNVINDILDFSKIEAGKVQLEAVCFNLTSALQEALQTIGLRASEKGLLIELNLAADLSQYVIGDPNRLRQVILNLVGNSVKFTESGRVSVAVSRGEGADKLHFAISDTGIGMTTEQTTRIFEPFSQADASTSRRFGGSGLGTTISKQIVELMGGTIWVESQLGVGSTFHFTVRLPDTSVGPDCLYQTVPRVAEYVSPRSFKVLLAEDIEANATLAILRLEQQEHRVTWVKNGQQALDAFRAGGYELILMDLQMPVLDGIEATRRIRQLEAGSSSHIPILALTASVLQHEREQCFQAGMDAIVGKPINIDELLEQMELMTPKNCGVARTVIKQGARSQAVIDFKPLVGVANIDKALATWRDPVIYADALQNFARERNDDAVKIAHLYDENAGNADTIESIRRIVHGLKGVSGNLALAEIFALASALDSQLHAGELPEMAGQLTALDVALKKACLAIAKLQLPQPNREIATSGFDAVIVVGLLQQLLLALDALNPETAEPLLQQLIPYLQQSDFIAIHNKIDHFDFDSAKREVETLISRLATSVDGGAR